MNFSFLLKFSARSKSNDQLLNATYLNDVTILLKLCIL